MTVFSYRSTEITAPSFGLIVLQSDERIEADFRAILPPQVELFVSRVPSADQVTSDTLEQMHGHLKTAASLLPPARAFDVVGYGCTSGSAQIGAVRVAEQVQAGTNTQAVTDPASALIAACGALGLRRLALLSPYIEPVSARLRDVLDHNDIATPVFGTFAEPNEAAVVRIAPMSIKAAAAHLTKDADVDGIFLSCTNLRAVEFTEELQAELGVPILSSNLVLAWHMCQLAGVETQLLDGARALTGR